MHIFFSVCSHDATVEHGLWLSLEKNGKNVIVTIFKCNDGTVARFCTNLAFNSLRALKCSDNDTNQCAAGCMKKEPLEAETAIGKHHIMTVEG